MRKLIINADDLGLSEYVNSQIEKCISLGVITSSTLMANAPAFEDGVRIAKRHPNISIGVHLNIVEFAPLTNLEFFKKRGVVGKDGCFIEGAFNVFSIDNELKTAVYEEWDAQISKIETAGIIPSHCDSHEHTHTIPALQGVLCDVLNKHHITIVRRRIIPSIRLMIRAKHQPVVHYDKSNAITTPRRNMFFRRFHLFEEKYISYKWNKTMGKQYQMTQAFYAFRDFSSNKDVLSMGGRDSVIELMCHPGNKPFQEETNALMKDKSWLVGGYELSNYHNL